MQHVHSIQALAPDDRPREKLLARGGVHLTDSELLAVLIGRGTPRMGALALAQAVLSDRGNSWFELGRLSVRQLTAYHGIGEVVALRIHAALEIARRRLTAPPEALITVRHSRDAYEACRMAMEDLQVEQLRVLLLNRGNQICRQVVLTSGGAAGTIADPKLIFQSALEHRASSFILVHNHPSGNIRPSEADLRVTQRVAQSGEMLDLPMTDHLIIGHGHYYSFADNGNL